MLPSHCPNNYSCLQFDRVSQDVALSLRARDETDIEIQEDISKKCDAGFRAANEARTNVNCGFLFYIHNVPQANMSELQGGQNA